MRKRVPARETPQALAIEPALERAPPQEDARQADAQCEQVQRGDDGGEHGRILRQTVGGLSIPGAPVRLIGEHRRPGAAPSGPGREDW